MKWWSALSFLLVTSLAGVFTEIENCQQLVSKVRSSVDSLLGTIDHNAKLKVCRDLLNDVDASLWEDNTLKQCLTHHKDLVDISQYMRILCLKIISTVEDSMAMIMKVAPQLTVNTPAQSDINNTNMNHTTNNPVFANSTKTSMWQSSTQTTMAATATMTTAAATEITTPTAMTIAAATETTTDNETTMTTETTTDNETTMTTETTTDNETTMTTETTTDNETTMTTGTTAAATETTTDNETTMTTKTTAAATETTTDNETTITTETTAAATETTTAATMATATEITKTATMTTVETTETLNKTNFIFQNSTNSETHIELSTYRNDNEQMETTERHSETSVSEATTLSSVSTSLQQEVSSEVVLTSASGINTKKSSWSDRNSILISSKSTTNSFTKSTSSGLTLSSSITKNSVNSEANVITQESEEKRQSVVVETMESEFPVTSQDEIASKGLKTFARMLPRSAAHVAIDSSQRRVAISKKKQLSEFDHLLLMQQNSVYEDTIKTPRQGNRAEVVPILTTSANNHQSTTSRFQTSPIHPEITSRLTDLVDNIQTRKELPKMWYPEPDTSTTQPEVSTEAVVSTPTTIHWSNGWDQQKTSTVSTTKSSTMAKAPLALGQSSQPSLATKHQTTAQDVDVTSGVRNESLSAEIITAIVLPAINEFDPNQHYHLPDQQQDDLEHIVDLNSAKAHLVQQMVLIVMVVVVSWCYI